MAKKEAVAQVVEGFALKELSVPVLTKGETSEKGCLKKYPTPRGGAMGCSHV